MTNDEINRMAREIADEAAWNGILDAATVANGALGWLDVSSLPDAWREYVDYLSARGLLERPDPENPNIVRRKDK